jgi:hypothetical protein
VTIRIPDLSAIVERRLLINYRLDPAVARTLLPSSLRPQLVNGCAVAGICLLRLGAMRPTVFNRAGLPPRVGWGAENAAHRIAVEWDDEYGTHRGVYVPRRHSASWLAVAAGGRIFPGVHEHARFEGSETESRIRIALTSRNTTVAADVAVTSTFASELFPTLADASAFFQAGSIGWSPSRDGLTLQGLQLATDSWRVDAGEVLEVQSSFFAALPAGSAQLDSVLVMRDVPITWSVPAEFAGRATAAVNRL